MKKAMEALSSGKLSYRKPANIFNVSKGGLQRRVNNKLKLSPSKQYKNILGKFRCVLSTEQEEELKTYLKNLDAGFYGLTILDLRVPVYEYCTRNCTPHPFNRETKIAGSDFVSGFSKRNNDLSLR